MGVFDSGFPQQQRNNFRVTLVYRKHYGKSSTCAPQIFKQSKFFRAIFPVPLTSTRAHWMRIRHPQDRCFWGKHHGRWHIFINLLGKHKSVGEMNWWGFCVYVSGFLLDLQRLRQYWKINRLQKLFPTKPEQNQSRDQSSSSDPQKFWHKLWQVKIPKTCKHHKANIPRDEKTTKETNKKLQATFALLLSQALLFALQVELYHLHRSRFEQMDALTKGFVRKKTWEIL